MLSTIHDDSMMHRPDRRHRNQCQTKPTCIADYNKYMGGVDCTDQLLKPYEVPRKTLKWYKKVAIHFMQLSMLNSSIVYQKDGDRKPFLGLQRDVIAALLFENGNGADMEIPREENIIRLTERHFVAPVPETASKRSLRRDAECATRRDCARIVATTVRPVRAIQDFVIFPVLNFTTPNSFTGCETYC